MIFRLATLLCCTTFCAPVLAAEPSERELAFFENKIRPVLVENCYQCHSAQAQQQGKLKGELLLDTRAGIRKGARVGRQSFREIWNIAACWRRFSTKRLKCPPQRKIVR